MDNTMIEELCNRIDSEDVWLKGIEFKRGDKK